MITRRVFALLALCAVCVLVGCERERLFVCLEVTDRGVCRGPKQELVVGRQYSVLVPAPVPGGSMLELVRFENGRAVVLGHAPIASGDADHAVNPLTLPKVGTYRLTLRDRAGNARASTNVSAPRPSVWNARTTTPAEAPRP
jgi:hypothetical protein